VIEAVKALLFVVLLGVVAPASALRATASATIVMPADPAAIRASGSTALAVSVSVEAPKDASCERVVVAFN
jgi:hypothetical protein